MTCQVTEQPSLPSLPPVTFPPPPHLPRVVPSQAYPAPIRRSRHFSLHRWFPALLHFYLSFILFYSPTLEMPQSSITRPSSTASSNTSPSSYFPSPFHILRLFNHSLPSFHLHLQSLHDRSFSPSPPPSVHFQLHLPTHSQSPSSSQPTQKSAKTRH